MSTDDVTRLIIILSVICIAILTGLNLKYWTDSSVLTFLSFQGETVAAVSEDLVISIKQPENRFSIYGVNQVSNLQLNISDLIDTNTGISILSKNIVLTSDSSDSTPSEISPDIPQIFDLSIRNSPTLELGMYEGGLFVSNGTLQKSVPISLKVTPPITKPLMLIIDGIVISIASWKIVGLLSYYLDTKMILGKPAYLDNYLIKVKRLNRRGAVNYVTTTFMIGGSTIIDIGSIIFGIAVGLILIPTSATILSITYLGNLEILTLIGTGLGIGSLKEFIKK